MRLALALLLLYTLIRDLRWLAGLLGLLPG